MAEYQNMNGEYEHDGWKHTPYEAYGAADSDMNRKKHSVWKAVVAGILVVTLVAGAAAGGIFYGRSLNGKNAGGAQASAQAAPAAAGTADLAGTAKTGPAKHLDLASTGGSVVVTDVTNVVDKAMPSIVSVFNNFTNTFNYWGMIYSQEQTATGSGIIIADNDEELLIVTNNHVVANEESLEVQFIDGATASALIKGTDRANDLAVITVSKADMEETTLDAIAVAEIGDSNTLKVGEPAIAIGNALGYGQSVTAGAVSAVDRQFAGTERSENTSIQTDAAINQGNSGGALLNINGEVIGINSNKIGGAAVEGMGYAIPISRAVPIIENLMGQGTKESDIPEEEQGVLGISGASVTSEVSQAYGMPQGVYVAQVMEGAAADEAGIQKGDIIVSLNGSTIASMEDLKEQLAFYRAGTEVTVKVMRAAGAGEYNEEEMTLTLSDRSVLGESSGTKSAGEAPDDVPEKTPGEGLFTPFRFNRGE